MLFREWDDGKAYSFPVCDECFKKERCYFCNQIVEEWLFKKYDDYLVAVCKNCYKRIFEK